MGANMRLWGAAARIRSVSNRGRALHCARLRVHCTTLNAHTNRTVLQGAAPCAPLAVCALLSTAMADPAPASKECEALIPITVVVGSTNPVKVASVARAFGRAFPAVAAAGCLTVSGVSAPSGISDQPMTDAETQTGAVNRAKAAAELYTAASGTPPTYAVGLEGGCQLETTTSASIGAEALASHMTCFAWMAILEVGTHTWGTARTGTFTLPPAVASLVAAGVELGVADDRVFGRTNSKQQDGAVGLLSKGLIDRTAYYEHALVLALVPFISREYYVADSSSGDGKTASSA